MMDNEFPPNSHAHREGRDERQLERAPEKKEVVRVTKSRATLRKKPLYKQFFDAFRPADNVGFVEYTLLEVLAPGIRDVAADAVHGAIDNALGTSIPRSRRGGRDGGYTSYNRMGSARPRDRRGHGRDDDRRSRRDRPSRGPSDHQEIIVDSRVEADEVIDNMFELISKYGVATMRDLLSLVGEPHNYTDEDWGWTDLRGARIHKVRNGYLLDLPRPEFLD